MMARTHSSVSSRSSPTASSKQRSSASGRSWQVEHSALISERVAVSPRVRDLFVSVVHILARRVLGAEVSRDEAGLLADAAAGDARSILARLEERSRIKRSAPGLRPDKHFQTRLVIAEVVFDAKGLAADGPIAKMQLIDKMIASQRAQAAREGELVKAE